MFKTPRYANATIKDVYDGRKPEDVERFKKRVANLHESSKKEAEKLVTSISSGAIYIHVTGLKGDKFNDNGDYFRWDELLKKKDFGEFAGQYTFATWIDRDVLENHNPDKIRGKILDSFPIRNEKCIDFLSRVDEKTNPNMAKGIRNGSITGTSMGVLVGHSYCSVCNNLAYDETMYCEHLDPKKLNLKARLYTGQDGNKYPDKIGQIVYEDNRDLIGVEDSIITEGMPAEQAAVIHKVLASKEEKDMPKGDNSIPQLSSDRLGANRPATGAVYRMEPNDPQAQLSAAVAQLVNKRGMEYKDGKVVAPSTAPTYTSSAAVVAAIDAGTLKKVEAISFVEKFKLVSAEKIENLTPAAAYTLLKNDIQREDELDAVIAQSLEDVKDGGDQAISESDAKHEDQPTPDGSVAVEDQLPNTETSTESKDVNKSKTEEQPEPVKAQSLEDVKNGGDQALSTSDAKPETKPAPKGNVDPHGQMPSTTVSDESDVGSAKHEEQPTPDGSVNVKKQLPNTDTSTESKDVNKSKPETQPEPVTSKKTVKADDITKPEVETMTKDEKVNKMTDLIQDLSELAEGLDGASKSESKPEEKKEESKEPKAEEKKEDKMPPFMKEKTEDKEEKDEPKAEDNMPPLFASYEVALVKNANKPTKSCYVVSCKGKNVWSFTAEDAFGEEVQKYLNDFHTSDYQKELVKALNKSGAKEVHASLFGEAGMVLAQEGLPEDKFEEPAGNMNASPDVIQDITNNDEADNKANNYSDLILETLATNIARDKSASSEEVIGELKDIFSSEENSNHFAGMLREKVETKRKEMSKTDDGGMTDLPPDAGDMGMPEMAPDAGQAMNELTALKKKIATLIPGIRQEITNLTRERDEYKAKFEARQKDDTVKARTLRTRALSAKKAELGLISEKDINADAVKLAQLTDEQLEAEVKMLENSVKIARKVVKNSKGTDYTNIEDTKTNVNRTVLASIPTQLDSDISKKTETFGWSKNRGR